MAANLPLKEFRYALVGDPMLLRPTHNPHGKRPFCLQSQRIDTLIGPFQYSFPYRKWGRDVLLARTSGFPGFTGNIGTVRFQTFASQQDAIAALIRDEVDFVPSITDPTLLSPPPPDIIVSSEYTPPNIHYLGFRTDMPPFNALAARQWILSCLDLDKLLVAGGVQHWAATGLMPPGVTGSAIPRPQPVPGDQAPQNITLLYNESERIDRTIAADIVAQLATAGCHVAERKCRGYDELLKAVQKGQGEMFLYNWFVKTDSPALRILDPLFHSSGVAGGTNLTGYHKTAVDNDIDTGNFSGAVTQILADAPVVVLYHARRRAAWRKGLVGLTLTAPECYPADQLCGVTI